MNTFRFDFPFIAALLVASMGVGLGQSPGFLPLSEVVPGMKGTGKTIFQGIQVEDFEVEVLGVLENIRPQQNMILARLGGDQIQKTGVFSGMSGSPVYIDGKLIGAIAYSFAFSREPIAGITPIQEIVDIFRQAPGEGRILSSSGTGRDPAALYQAKALSDLLPIRSFPFDDLVFDTAAWGMNQELRPIGTPVSLSGLSPQALRFVEPGLRSLGMLPVASMGSGRSNDFGEPTLEPGSTLAVQMIRGDLDASASGTVTHVSGNRIYAFGHPFMGAGFTDMPMTKAAVLTVIPSLSTSQKVSASGEFIGSIKQDRSTGVMGLLGEKPKMIPVQVNLLTSRNEKRGFRYEVITDDLLTPLLTTLAVFNSITSSESAIGGQTLKVQCKIAIKDQPEVQFENSVSDLANANVTAAVTAGAPLAFLMNAGFDDLEVEQMEVDISAVEQTRKAVVEQIWVDRGELRAGEELQLTVFLRKPNGDRISEKYPLKIPEQVSPGPLEVVVGEGMSLTQLDTEAGTSKFEPENVHQLIRAINNLKKNNRLYIRLYRKHPGVIVGGEGLPELPPSLLELYGSSRTSGSAKAIDRVIYVEHELPPTDFVLEGYRTIRISVRG
jgi:hypothetical protein